MLIIKLVISLDCLDILLVPLVLEDPSLPKHVTHLHTNHAY